MGHFRILPQTEKNLFSIVDGYRRGDQDDDGEHGGPESVEGGRFWIGRGVALGAKRVEGGLCGDCQKTLNIRVSTRSTDKPEIRARSMWVSQEPFTHAKTLDQAQRADIDRHAAQRGCRELCGAKMTYADYGDKQ